MYNKRIPPRSQLGVNLSAEELTSGCRLPRNTTSWALVEDVCLN